MGTSDTPTPGESVATRELKQDALVDRLLKDPAHQPLEVIVLFGFLGKSVSNSHWRIYQTLALDEYVEVLEADIVHREELASEANPLGGSMLWIRATAKLVHARVVAQEAQADFLHGEIRATGPETLAATDRLGGALAVAYPRTYQAICAIYTYHPDACWYRAALG